MDIYIEDAVKHVRNVSNTRNYWFIRTYGGEVFNEFVQKGYVGIGFNDVPYEYLANCKPNEKDMVNDSHFNKLRDYLAKTYDFPKGTDTKWTRQLIDFQHRIKIGDLVIIPSHKSSEISIGEVKSGVSVVKENGTFFHNEKYESYPEKRIKIDWKRTKYKEQFNGELRNLLSSQQAVTKADLYGDIIEGHISNLFVKDNETHLVIQIDHDESINAFHLNNFLTCLTYFYQEFCRENGYEVDEELYIKIKVQSKGSAVFKGLVVVGLLGISGIVALSNNPKFKLDLGVFGSVEGESGGFLQSISDFLDANEERRQKAKLFDESIKHLEAKNQNSDLENQATGEIECEGEEDDC